VRRAYRIGLAGTALAASIAAVLLLTWFSNTAEGPLSTALDWLGTRLGATEYRVRQRLNGGLGRSGELAWFQPYRDDPNRLRHPDAVLLGAYDSSLPDNLSGIANLEHSLRTTLPLIQFYNAWGDKPEEQFPLQLATAIWDVGSVPVLTWEPWLVDFRNEGRPWLPRRETRDRHGLASVSHGDYDFYIDRWASEAARFRKAIFLRFAHEMNDPYRYPWGPQNNTKEEFIAAWRHVRARFDRAGARNVIWTWSPHIAYRYWDLYYPGDQYVDWVATGSLNFGTVAPQWSRWWSFHDIFGRRYPLLASFGKPIMVAEFGSLAVGGDRAAWYREALTNFRGQYPAVKTLLFFNSRSDQTVTYQKLDWTINDDSAVTRIVAQSIKSWKTNGAATTSARANTVAK
jgi:hypothetical protein